MIKFAFDSLVDDKIFNLELINFLKLVIIFVDLKKKIKIKIKKYNLIEIELKCQR